MNIFAVDLDPRAAAIALHDRHVVKMTLESAQMLSTVAHDIGLQFPGQYKPTHAKHPCVVWARKTRGNLDWLLAHGMFLGEEYTYRFKREHKSHAVIRAAIDAFLVQPLIDYARTPFAQAMPDKYKCDDAVAAYRAYYIGEKIKPNTRWTNRARPVWAGAVT